MGSVKELLNIISLFSLFLGLYPSLSKCEAAGIVLLIGVKVDICEIKCIGITKDAIKILGVFVFFFI